MSTCFRHLVQQRRHLPAHRRQRTARHHTARCGAPPIAAHRPPAQWLPMRLLCILALPGLQRRTRIHTVFTPPHVCIAAVVADSSCAFAPSGDGVVRSRTGGAGGDQVVHCRFPRDGGGNACVERASGQRRGRSRTCADWRCGGTRTLYMSDLHRACPGRPPRARC